MKRLILTLALALALCSAVGIVPGARPAAASGTQSHPAFLDKTRFVLHMGAAYYAFHHFVWNRYKAHDFASGAPHRTKYIIEAGIALLFAYHEVKVAYGIAQKSNSKTLHALISPLNKLAGAFSAIGNKFHSGQYSDSDVTSLNSSANSFQSQATGNGYGFKDRTVPIPGL